MGLWVIVYMDGIWLCVFELDFMWRRLMDVFGCRRVGFLKLVCKLGLVFCVIIVDKLLFKRIDLVGCMLRVFYWRCVLKILIFLFWIGFISDLFNDEFNDNDGCIVFLMDIIKFWFGKVIEFMMFGNICVFIENVFFIFFLLLLEVLLFLCRKREDEFGFCVIVLFIFKFIEFFEELLVCFLWIKFFVMFIIGVFDVCLFEICLILYDVWIVKFLFKILVGLRSKCVVSFDVMIGEDKGLYVEEDIKVV